MHNISLYCIVLILKITLAQQFYNENSIFKNELTVGINFNTIAPIVGGFTLKLSRLANEKYETYHCFLFEGTNVKHPKEVKVSSAGGGNTYVKGKENHFIPIRTLYGREHILFQKAKDEGVQLNIIYAGGPVWGILKPYYILYGPNQDNAQYVKNNASRSDNLIQGQGGFLMGMDEAKIIPGLSTRLSLNLVFDSFRSNLIGVEVGMQMDIFPQKIRIIPIAGDKNTFISGFIVGYFGNRW